MSTRYQTLIATLVLLLLGCEPEDLIRNAMIDRWCGDRPCNWEVKGKIERVGTWHEKDYAVRFVSDHAQISQLNPNVSSADHYCYAFKMLAKVDHGTRLYLELDFLDDGHIDSSRRIAEGDWDVREFKVEPPTWYKGVRFILRKDGPGYAALAQLSAQTTSDCGGTPIELDNRPPFATCEEDKQCKVGICNLTDSRPRSPRSDWEWDSDDTAAGYCYGCMQDVDCGDAGLCVAVKGDAVRQCVLEAGTAFGAPCSVSEQCATGVCCNGYCSTCCTDQSCPDAQKCDFPTTWSDGTDGGVVRGGFWPKLCAPGEHLGASGDTCTGDADCKSAVCVGVDTRPCADACVGCASCAPLFVTGGTCE